MLSSRPFPQTSPTLLAILRDGAQAIGQPNGQPGGKQSGWQEFFSRYAPAVFRAARLRGLDADDADDIVQQVMTAICVHIGEFHYDRGRGQFRQWVRRIADNMIINQHRRRRPTACDPELLDARLADAPTADELWSQQWRLQDMHFCLEQVAADVSPRRMEAFRMYVLEDVSAAETAAAVDMTVGSVYVTRNHLLNMLRQRMEELEREDGDA